ncbi:hypothetical protein AK812_SmicGene8320 [Symbiodinium microadriaticum]|uniref:Uncharacterized protein n=1 Tax=Symbiodinium microadriaticum TaxID=2951 RepID=A0A1Q9EL72_SYMMI|nr:hypothetical protein AK812_SmicGene8320 [Symbiodinium microadriaticum]
MRVYSYRQILTNASYAVVRAEKDGVKLTGDKFLHNDNILVSGPPHVISVNITKVKFEATAGHGAAKVLFYENVGWFLEPQFSLDKALKSVDWREVENGWKAVHDKFFKRMKDIEEVYTNTKQA